jgi:hypothetical protein
LPESFGIEQQAVHIEDHGAWAIRQCHAARVLLRNQGTATTRAPPFARI